MADRQIDTPRRHQADSNGQELHFNRQLGMLIRQARHHRQLTQDALARELGITRASVANLERGAQAPTAYRLTRIAAALGVEPSDLLPQLNKHVTPHVDNLAPQVLQYVERVKQAGAKRARRGQQ